MAEQILLSGTRTEQGRVFRYFYIDEVGYGTIESAQSLELRSVETGEVTGSIDLVHVGFTDIEQSYGLRLEPEVSAEQSVGNDDTARQMIEQAMSGLDKE